MRTGMVVVVKKTKMEERGKSPNFAEGWGLEVE
jgi:hypothetical protein